MNQLKNRNYQGLQLNPAPIGSRMGEGVPYSTDGFNLKYNPTEWDYLYNRPLTNPANNPVVIQGTPVPLAYEEVRTPLPDESMFIFQKNIAHPNCCPSTFSTSQGCVCTTSQQRYLIGYTRGGNNSFPGEYPFI